MRGNALEASQIWRRAGRSDATRSSSALDGPTLVATPTVLNRPLPLGLAVSWLTNSSNRYAYMGNAFACESASTFSVSGPLYIHNPA